MMETSGEQLNYDALIRHAGYVTGVAYYTNRDGQEFAIHISGEPKVVKASLGDIFIDTIQLTKTEPPKPQDPRESLPQYESFITMQRKKLTQLKRILNSYSTNPSLAVKKLHQWEQNYVAESGCRSMLPNWERSRLIEFEILTPLDPRQYYQFSIRLDPSVAQGHCDIYKLIGSATFVTTTVVTQLGNPDAYLYCGRKLIDSSTNPQGQNETVEGTRPWLNFGAWFLHVYGAGRGSAEYEVSLDWNLSSDEQTGCPH